MNKTPLISVYVPTRNRLDFLKKAIQSVENQTFENWELIIVNDASIDGTKDYLDQLIKENPKIKAIHHKESLGACVSRNDAIFSAKGKFITGLDDDDEFKKDRLQRFIDNWCNRKLNTIALFSSKDVIKNGVYIRMKIQSPFSISQKDLLYGNVMGNQIFTKTQSLIKIGGFDENLKMWQDYDCWYRLLTLGDASYIPYSTYIFEESDRADRITKATKEKLNITINYFIKKHKLTFKEKQFLKINLIYYGQEKYNILFYLKMLFLTFFDKKMISVLNKEYFYPLLIAFKNRILNK